MALEVPPKKDESLSARWRILSQHGDEPAASIRQYPLAHWTVIEFIGELDVAMSPMLRRTVDETTATLLLFDLTRVTFLDASGLEVLAAARRKVVPLGGQVHLVGPVDRVRKVLTITQFHKIFPIHDSLEDAVGLPPAPHTTS